MNLFFSNRLIIKTKRVFDRRKRTLSAIAPGTGSRFWVIGYRPSTEGTKLTKLLLAFRVTQPGRGVGGRP